MTGKEYMAAVVAGQYPVEPRVPLDAPFENGAGVIQNLVLAPVQSVTLIDSYTGAVRSNHFHRTDWHFMFVLMGEMHYYWKAAGSSIEARMSVFKEGALMFTPPMVIHATYFPSPTRIMTFARNLRDHDSHESDLVRQKLIEIVNGRVVCG